VRPEHTGAPDLDAQPQGRVYVVGVRTTAGGMNDATERMHPVYAVLLVGWP
jgi:hypothetical protein